MISILNAQKPTIEPPEKPSKLPQKSRKQVKLNKIFLSHYQGVEVLEQKKDFKIFGQN